MKNVKFKGKGVWADPNPLVPQLEVEAGKTYEVSNELAEIVEEAGRGSIIKNPAVEKLKKAQGAADKAKAEHVEAQGAADKAKAEHEAATGNDKAKAEKALGVADKALATAAEKLETADKAVAELQG